MTNNHRSSYYLKELPYRQDSSTLFNTLVDWPWAIFLDSCKPQGEQGRYDIMSAKPYKTLLTQGLFTTVTSFIDNNIKEEISTKNPFDLIKQHLENTDSQAIPLLPFWGGALGYFAYDLAERLGFSIQSKSVVNTPDMAIGFYNWGIIVDHKEKTSKIFAQPGMSKRDWEDLLGCLDSIPLVIPPPLAGGGGLKGRRGGVIKSNMSFSRYNTSFNKIQDHIREGDCYQVNFAQCFSAKAPPNSWQTYQILRQANPAPYSAFMRISKEVDIISLSPEQFLHVHNNNVQTKPIKGTRPRDPDPKKDALLAQELLASEKDRAENLMIVDLLRNDLGKNCITGSIKVIELFKLESFASVHHLVSIIKGQLDSKYHSIDLLRNCFPGGSITGAPKKRAMEIIANLEPQRRSIYCGSMGYINYNGNMETNIIIRTLIICRDTLYCYAGGGVVADSDVEQEYQETFAKVSKIIKNLN